MAQSGTSLRTTCASESPVPLHTQRTHANLGGCLGQWSSLQVVLDDSPARTTDTTQILSDAGPTRPSYTPHGVCTSVGVLGSSDKPSSARMLPHTYQ